MEPVNLDALREAAARATPGPWFAYDRGVGYHVCTSVGPSEYDYTPLPEGQRTDLGRRQDAEFIAVANPKAILTLLDGIEDLFGEIADLQDEIAALRGSKESR